MDDVGTFDRFARLYDRAMPGAKRWVLRTAVTHANRPVERAVDLAGGTGRGLRSLPSLDGFVLDAAPGMARQARRRGLAAVVGDAGRIPLRAASVDAVLVIDAYHHLAAPGRTVREAARVLRPGGVLVVADFDPATVRGRALVAAEHLVGFDSEFVTPAALSDELTDAGFTPVLVDTGFGYTVAGVLEREE